MRIPLTAEEVRAIIKNLTGLEVNQYLLIEKILEQVTPNTLSQDEINQARVRALIYNNEVYKVVGVTFDGKQDVLRTIQEGDILELTPEPNNKFDPNAVAVSLPDGSPVGYVPKNFAAMMHDIAPLLAVQVVSVLGGDGFSLGIRVKFIRKDTPTVVNLLKVQDEIAILPANVLKEAQESLTIFLAA
jgi:hypothetical protein